MPATAPGIIYPCPAPRHGDGRREQRHSPLPHARNSPAAGLARVGGGRKGRGEKRRPPAALLSPAPGTAGRGCRSASARPRLTPRWQPSPPPPPPPEPPPFPCPGEERERRGLGEGSDSGREEPVIGLLTINRHDPRGGPYQVERTQERRWQAPRLRDGSAARGRAGAAGRGGEGGAGQRSVPGRVTPPPAATALRARPPARVGAAAAAVEATGLAGWSARPPEAGWRRSAPPRPSPPRPAPPLTSPQRPAVGEVLSALRVGGENADIRQGKSSSLSMVLFRGVSSQS